MEENLEKKDVYEVGYHLLPTIGEENIQHEVEVIHKAISDNGGEFITEAAPELRTLAYEISKRKENKYTTYNKAYFGWVKFEMFSNNVEILDKGLKANENILRFIIVKTVKENTIHTPKVASVRVSDDVGGTPVSEMEEEKGGGEVSAESAEEIDKSIEDLVVN